MESLWFFTVIVMFLSLGSAKNEPEQCSDWKVGPCSVTCGGGVQTLTKTCTISVECNTQNCPAKPPKCEKKPPPCVGGLDIAIVLDKSNSIYGPDLQKVLTFFKMLFESFHPGPEGDHFGIIEFGREARVVFNFDDSKDFTKKELMKRIDAQVNSQVSGLRTNTDKALKLANEELLTTAGGDRPEKPNVMIVFTDGKPTNETAFNTVADALSDDFESKKVHTVVIGVSRRLGSLHRVLRRIAQLTYTTSTSDVDDQIFEVDNFGDLKGKIQKIKNSVCTESGGQKRSGARRG